MDNTHMTTRVFVTLRAYFRGDITTIYCVTVNANTIRNEAFMANNDMYCPTSKRGLHIASVSGCPRYIIMKHVANMGCCVAAVKISTNARPTRKQVVAFLNIFKGSKKKTTSNKPLATKVVKEMMMI